MAQMGLDTISPYINAIKAVLMKRCWGYSSIWPKASRKKYAAYCNAFGWGMSVITWHTKLKHRDFPFATASLIGKGASLNGNQPFQLAAPEKNTVGKSMHAPHHLTDSSVAWSLEKLKGPRLERFSWRQSIQPGPLSF